MLKSVKYLFNTWYNSIYFWWMKKKAMDLHKMTGKQYHIIPTRTEKGKVKLMIVDNDTCNVINKHLPKKNKLTAKDLYKQSYFSTSFKSPFKK